MWSFAYVVVLLSFGFALAIESKTDFKNVEYISLKQFDEFKDSSEIRVVYFYKRNVPRLQSFYREYERSAELLKAYNVRCAVVDCTPTPQQDFCGNKKVEHYVYAFRDGYELLQLELESMFDVNSIMSNILQLVLLRDVPIVQSMTELYDLEDSVKGQHDLIFAFHRAIGTYEHRLFMDIAYAYQSKYKFAVTTEKTTASFLPGADEDPEGFCKIWVFNCQTTPLTQGAKRTHCPAFKYTGKLDMVELASFVKALALPSVYRIPKDGPSNPYSDVSIHILTLYHDNEGLSVAEDYARRLSTSYRGMLGIITVNVDSVVPEEFQYSGSLPAARLQFKNIDDERFMSGEMDEGILSNFVRDGLADFQKGVRSSSSSHGESHTDVVGESYADKIDAIEKEVNNEDDQVAKAVYELRRAPPNLTSVPALTDKTFLPTISQRDMLVVLFYLKVDATSHAFLHSYAEVGASFSPADSPLARVECFDWTDVCERENITSYPTVYMYRRGQRPMPYRGHLDKTALLTAVKLLQLDRVIELTKEKDVRAFSEGRYPEDISLTSNIPVSVLGLLSDPSHIAEFQKTAKGFAESVPFGLVTDAALVQQVASDNKVKLPAVLVFNREDSLKPLRVYGKEMKATYLARFITAATIQTFGEITARNFPLIHNQFKPLLVVFRGSSSSVVMETMSQVALDPEFSWAIFGWMDVSGLNSLGSKILYEYTRQPKVPHISLVVRQKSEVYNFPGTEISKETVSQWLRSVKQEKRSPSINLPRGTWRPKHEGYDFLRMIDEGIVDHSDDDIGFDNEMGLGFDEDGNYNPHTSMSEEGVKLSNSVDEMYRDGDYETSSEDEVGDIEHSRLASHHKRGPRGDKSTAATQKPTTDTPAPESVTHDGGEL